MKITIDRVFNNDTLFESYRNNYLFHELVGRITRIDKDLSIEEILLLLNEVCVINKDLQDKLVTHIQYFGNLPERFNEYRSKKEK